MKKVILIILLTGCFLFAAFYTVQKTRLLVFSKFSATSNRPTYNPGDLIISSALKKPDNNSIILFKRPDNSIWVFRCIGKGGDVIEMKNETVYLNGKLLSEPFAWNEYYITKDQMLGIIGYIDKNKNTVNRINDSLFSIALTTAELKKYNLNLKPYCASKDSINQSIFPEFKKMGYNEDNFGPIKIPENCFFVLGDNRHDAYDSRYFGFVKADEITSTVIK